MLAVWKPTAFCLTSRHILPVSINRQSLSTTSTNRFCRMNMSSTKSATSNSELWAKLALDTSVLVSAHIITDGADKVAATWSQRDVIASRKRLYSTTYIKSSDSRYLASTPIEIDAVRGANFYYSPSKKRLLRFTSASSDVASDSNKGASGTLVEVWEVGSGLQNVWMIDNTIHGPVFTDEWFGNVSWSPDESMIVYVAERPTHTATSSDESKEATTEWNHALQHKFRSDARDPLGEAYVCRSSPGLYIADLHAKRSVPVSAGEENLEGAMRFGDPQWSSDGEWIVGTMRRGGYVDMEEIPEGELEMPYDLGIRYCYNRYSAIVAFPAPKCVEDIVSIAKQMRVISSPTNIDDFCCNSPRFSRDGDYIIYVSAPHHIDEKKRGKALPHNTTKVLRAVHLDDGEFSEPQTLIAVPVDPNYNEFPGLYLHELPSNPWLDSETIVFNSIWGSANKILSTKFLHHNGGLHSAPLASTNGGKGGEEKFNTEGKVSIYDWQDAFVKNLQTSDDHCDIANCSVTLHDISGNHMLVSASSPGDPAQLFLLRVNAVGEVSGVETVSVPSSRTQALRKNVRLHKTVDLVAHDTASRASFGMKARIFNASEDRPHTRFQATIILPSELTSGSMSPLVVFPHGGPHTSTVIGYSQAAMGLLRKGFAVLYVNYRGSLGLGQRSLETLPGNIGTQDINEVVQATRWVAANEQFCVDKSRIAFVGGSHSGFIGAHTSLISGLFCRTVLRNPVMNVASMVGGTDIPDWCFCEAGVAIKDGGLVPDAEGMAAMYDVSPVSRVGECVNKKLKPGKTLLQVGGADRRVPAGQSLEWRRMLNMAFGDETVKVRWYGRSGHAIDEVPEGDDAWVCAYDFLDEGFEAS